MADRKNYQCMECGKKMTHKQAEKMECPGCGGSDIDLTVPFTPEYPGRDASNPFEW